MIMVTAGTHNLKSLKNQRLGVKIMFVQQRKRHHHQWSEPYKTGSINAASMNCDSMTPTMTNKQQPLASPFEAQPATSSNLQPAIAADPILLPAPLTNQFQLSSVVHGDLKRSYPCRTCRLSLSSASNRVRHERTKHKEQSLTLVTSPGSKSMSCKRSSKDAFGPAAAVDSEGEQQIVEGGNVGSGEESELEDEMESDSPAAAESAEFDAMELDTSEPPAIESLTVDSVDSLRPLLKEEDLQARCYPFLVWLSQPPITQCEALVKARRVKSLGQLQPVKSNLRFIFALLYEREAIIEVELQQLKQLALCQTLFEAMTSRQVGSGRIHAVFLLLKKVLVYLSSQESAARRLFIQPSAYESFFFVDNICSDSSHRRKQESRNRALLGVQTSQLLHKSQPMQTHQAFVVPRQWGAEAPKASITLGPQPNPTVTTAAAAAQPASVSDQSPSNELSKEELQQVAKGCIAFFHTHMQQQQQQQQQQHFVQKSEQSGASSRSSSSQLQLQADRLFMSHLVTATLCLGLAPRSQVLKQLRIGSSFVKQADGRYWVKVLAQMSKNGKPTMFSISAQLTAAFDLYLEVIRPRLLAQLASPVAHDYVFVKRDGSAPRCDFSTCTCLVTQRLIGRPVNAHAFRAAVVTAFYETGASQSEMDVLATIMAHDPTTAKSFYYRPQIAAAAVQTNDRMTELLLQQQG